MDAAAAAALLDQRKDSHAGGREVVSVVAEHVPGQHDAGGPRLAAAARGEVLVDLERRGEQAAKVEDGVAGWFVLGQGGEVLVEGEGVKARGRGR